jgi:NAD(P)H-dependent FMN reductase
MSLYPPSVGQYGNAHTKKWAAKIASFDAFVFVTPEYNPGTSAALKNALDDLFAEWNNKAAGFVSYGGAGGARAVEQLRLVMGELLVADVRAQVMLSMFTDFENFSVFKPDPRHEAEMSTMLDQVISWGAALKAWLAGTLEKWPISLWPFDSRCDAWPRQSPWSRLWATALAPA